jgi:hypothetical protein
MNCAPLFPMFFQFFRSKIWLYIMVQLYKLDKSRLGVCNATFGRKLKFEERFLFTKLKFIPSNHGRIRRWVGLTQKLFAVIMHVYIEVSSSSPNPLSSSPVRISGFHPDDPGSNPGNGNGFNICDQSNFLLYITLISPLQPLKKEKKGIGIHGVAQFFPTYHYCRST